MKYYSGVKMSHITSRNKLSVYITLLLIISALGYGVFLWSRQAVLYTDPLWKAAYLDNERRELKLKFDLLRRGFLPQVKEISLEIEDAELAELISRSPADWLFFSPFLSAKLLQNRALLQFTGARGVLISFEDRDGEDEELSFYKLYLDAATLADPISDSLMRHLDEYPGIESIILVWNQNSWMRQGTAESLLKELKVSFNSLRVELRDPGRLGSVGERESERLFVFLGGDRLQNERLELIDKRGGKAMVVGPIQGRRAWPSAVRAIISVDYGESILQLLDDREEGSAVRKEYPILFSARQ